jgi:hypothetical protein
MPRSASSSSGSRYDSPNCRYQRTASTITSGGNRKPTNAERAGAETPADRMSCTRPDHAEAKPHSSTRQSPAEHPRKPSTRCRVSPTGHGNLSAGVGRDASVCTTLDQRNSPVAAARAIADVEGSEHLESTDSLRRWPMFAVARECHHPPTRRAVVGHWSGSRERPTDPGAGRREGRGRRSWMNRH